ncbi:hypothetical protein AV530_008981 [Patagioenas fasciata monilis]|uniref:Uncharacterized protein n=1 Tax=Patagioenas fasciata monilis TaxID=372326 RepID=A0A1V4JTJ2_PATFA|nr:hypothetical protein AV530_008981 [Patagioenas fasciata monilis]
MPASSKMDLPLAKAKPIRDSGSTSVITYLRRVEKTCTTPAAATREEWEYVRETAMQTPRSVKKEAIPLQPMETNSGVDIYQQPVEDPTPEKVDSQRRL